MADVHDLASRALFEAAVAAIPLELLTQRGWVFNSSDYPVVDVTFSAPGRTPMRVALRCDGWDSQPPSVEFQAADGTPLSTAPTAPGGQFHAGPHHATGRPFLCMAGSREYHTHSSHTGDVWENYKSKAGYDLGGIITQIWRAWSTANP